MYTFKQRVKDWRIWYKLITALLIIAFLLEMLINWIIDINASGPEGIWAVFVQSEDGVITHVGYDYLGFIINYFGYFTIQSNILVAIWLLVGVFKQDQEGETKLLRKAFSLSTVTYITVTALIFNFMLLPQILSISNNNFGTLWWVEQMVLHTFGPIATIIYFLFFMKIDLEFNFKNFIKKDFFLMAIYPIIYLIYSLIKGELVYQSLGADASLATKHMAYPYFFLEIHNKNVFGLGTDSLLNNGLFWMFAAIIIIIGIIIGLGSLYLFVCTKTTNIRNKWSNNVPKEIKPTKEVKA